VLREYPDSSIKILIFFFYWLFNDAFTVGGAQEGLDGKMRDR
jgi:hypothetical protein